LFYLDACHAAKLGCRRCSFTAELTALLEPFVAGGWWKQPIDRQPAQHLGPPACITRSWLRREECVCTFTPAVCSRRVGLRSNEVAFKRPRVILSLRIIYYNEATLVICKVSFNSPHAKNRNIVLNE